MLYIIRHGKTDWNNENKLQGKTDIPLNEEGREMAKRAADEYKDVHFDICFSSPLIRAKETAEILLEGRNIPIEYDERLEEMGFGIYEGSKDYFENAEYPLNLFFETPQDYKIPVIEGESMDELFKRTGDFLNEKVYPLLKEGKDVLIVGHGAMNCAIVCQIKKKNLKDFWSDGIENCKLLRLF